nr:AMP-binding protein [uncultured Rhodoferax sp.]
MTSIAVQAADLPLACLYRWEKQRPHEIYLSQPMSGGQVLEITWAQAGGQVRCMAQWLQSQGWPAGSRIAIIGKNSAHWILADLAIAMAGYVSVPIYPTFNGEALSYILLHSESKALFVGKMDDIANLRTGVPPELPLIALPLAPNMHAHQWLELVSATKPLTASPEPAGENTSTIIYTSGTTGKPKGVVHTFNSMAWGVRCATLRFPMNAADRYISYLPLAHVAERMLIEQASLRYGGHVFFAESLDTFLKDLQRARPTIFFSVPRLWVKFQQGVLSRVPAGRLRILLSLPWIGTLVRRKILQGLGLDQCRIAAGGAAPMPADVLQWYRHLGLDLVEVYGMTENSGVSHSTLPGSRQTDSVGQPYDGVESRIDADSGEIQMRSPGLMKAYYRDPELTVQALTPDGWLRTGDKGLVDHEGCLRITGRLKDLFKTSKGKYIAPVPIEDKLVMHSAIEACAVTGADFPQPFALAMLSPDAMKQSQSATGRLELEASLESYLHTLNQALEPHEKLAFLAAITTSWTAENGLVTPTLKVKRHTIESAYGASFHSWYGLKKAVVWPDKTA